MLRPIVNGEPKLIASCPQAVRHRGHRMITNAMSIDRNATPKAARMNIGGSWEGPERVTRDPANPANPAKKPSMQIDFLRFRRRRIVFGISE